MLDSILLNKMKANRKSPGSSVGSDANASSPKKKKTKHNSSTIDHDNDNDIDLFLQFQGDRSGPVKSLPLFLEEERLGGKMLLPDAQSPSNLFGHIIGFDETNVLIFIELDDEQLLPLLCPTRYLPPSISGKQKEFFNNTLYLSSFDYFPDTTNIEMKKGWKSFKDGVFKKKECDDNFLYAIRNGLIGINQKRNSKCHFRLMIRKGFWLEEDKNFKLNKVLVVDENMSSQRGYFFLLLEQQNRYVEVVQNIARAAKHIRGELIKSKSKLYEKIQAALGDDVEDPSDRDKCILYLLSGKICNDRIIGKIR